MLPGRFGIPGICGRGPWRSRAWTSRRAGGGGAHLLAHGVGIYRIAAEQRLDRAHSVGDGRVGREPGRERVRERVGEEQVARFTRLRMADPAAAVQPADLGERAGDAPRVARELHGRGVGEELALARHRRLDEAREHLAE
jgi:hypothetical protein